MKKKIQLTREEKRIEEDSINGKYIDLAPDEFNQIAEAITARKKDTVLNIRVNSQDLESIKQKAKQYGIKYQTFIAELIHRVAHSS